MTGSEGSDIIKMVGGIVLSWIDSPIGGEQGTTIHGQHWENPRTWGWDYIRKVRAVATPDHIAPPPCWVCLWAYRYASGKREPRVHFQLSHSHPQESLRNLWGLTSRNLIVSEKGEGGCYNQHSDLVRITGSIEDIVVSKQAVLKYFEAWPTG